MSMALAMLAAVLLDAWLGEPRRAHPLIGFGRVVRWIEARHAGAGFALALRLNLVRNKLLRGWRHRPSGPLRASGVSA